MTTLRLLISSVYGLVPFVAEKIKLRSGKSADRQKSRFVLAEQMRKIYMAYAAFFPIHPGVNSWILGLDRNFQIMMIFATRMLFNTVRSVYFNSDSKSQAEGKKPVADEEPDTGIGEVAVETVVEPFSECISPSSADAAERAAVLPPFVATCP